MMNRLWQWLSLRLPRSLVFWCAARVLAATNVPRDEARTMTAMDALSRWGVPKLTDRLTRARDTALLTTMRYLCGTPDEQGVTPTEYTFQAARSELERALAAVAAFREASKKEVEG